MPQYASIALSGPIKRTFTYRVPESIAPLAPAQRVLVPFGRTRKIGFFLGYTDRIPDIEIKDITTVIDRTACLNKELFEFCLWMADYYFANPADCLWAALPSVYKRRKSPDLYFSDGSVSDLPEGVETIFKPGAKLTASIVKKIADIEQNLLDELLGRGQVVERWPDEILGKREKTGYRCTDPDAWDAYYERKKFSPSRFEGQKDRSELKSEGWTEHYIRGAVNDGVLEVLSTEVMTSPLDFIEARQKLDEIILNDEQQIALHTLISSLDDGFKAFLLHGVTGSGKTIVYCHLCREVLRRGKTALVLTPEIALSSTTLAYFRGFFGDRVTVIHSAMTERERLESWQGVRSGRYQIVVGPRSALFAPLEKPGVVIVDEEHDGSYKQDDPSPRFHGRDSAIMRAKMLGVPVLLGSASPSFESYHHASAGRYELLKLTRRPGGASLPTVRIVDMKSDRLRGDLPYFSYSLKKEAESRFEADEQVIFFLNRRGHSPQLKCADCGRVPECPNCRVNLTYHKVGSKLSCHYCGHLAARYNTCPHCGGHEFIYLGVGTQKVEENIPRLFDKARTARLDSDTASGRKRAYTILSDFSKGKSNLLLGTQMVTKGLDLPGVTLVGVLSADMSLDLPDFRASEKAFARLLQVAGRSGRSKNPGEVLIQTFYPEHEVIRDAARQDYEGFYLREIASRKELGYPPFSRIVNIVLSCATEAKLHSEALAFRERLLEMVAAAKLAVKVLGPAPCPMYRLRNRYRQHIFIKTQQPLKLVRALTEWEGRLPRFKLPSTIKLTVDVDPDDMM